MKKNVNFYKTFQKGNTMKIIFIPIFSFISNISKHLSKVLKENSHLVKYFPRNNVLSINIIKLFLRL